MKVIIVTYNMFLMLMFMFCGCDRTSRACKQAWICLEMAGKAENEQQYGVAEEEYRQALDEVNKDGRKITIGFSGWQQVYMRQGKYVRALEISRQILQSIKKEDGVPMDMSNQPQDFLQQHCFIGDIYLAWGKNDEALKEYEVALKYGENMKLMNSEYAAFNILAVYPHIGNFYLQQGNYKKAIVFLQEKMDCETQKRSPADIVARAKNELARAYYCAGDDLAAEKLLQDAAGRNAKSFVVFEADLAQSLIMLGWIEEHRREHDKALKAFQSAVTVLDGKLCYRVEQADVWNQVGHYQFKQGILVEAAKSYNEAIRLRRETSTQTHPNCADAIKGLADVAAYQNELTSATLQATEALKILDTALVPTHPRIAPTLIALSSIDILAGHPEPAAPLLARIETIVQKPLGPWKEDFMDTAAFYAGLLKKAGRLEAAARLDQLAALQKNKR